MPRAPSFCVCFESNYPFLPFRWLRRIRRETYATISRRESPQANELRLPSLMNHLLQSICPAEENTRPKTCYFVIGEIAIRMFAREKEMLAKGNASEHMGNALNRSRKGNSNGQRFRKKQANSTTVKAPSAALCRFPGFRLSATRSTSNGPGCLSNARFPLRATSLQFFSRRHASCIS